MKFKSLQILPSGQKGWKSDLLVFGDHITQIYGPNGCGKTPLVQSIVFGLGFPCVFRDDIYDKCSYSVLTVETVKGDISIKRLLSKDFDIELTEPNGRKQRFFKEKEYSSYMFELMGYNVENLVSSQKKITYPYMSTFLPLFYLDQDEGYSKIYYSPYNFVADQFSEMMRIAFDLPIKNSFDKKKDKFRAKEELDSWDRSVQSCSRELELAKETASLIKKSSNEIIGEIEQLNNEYEGLKKSGVSYDESVKVFDRMISRNKQTVYSISDEIAEIIKRTSSINQIVGEINTEIETLNINEEAKRVFLSFNEICSSDNCQLFSSSTESYSKNLLYLKDQIKDLKRNADIDQLKEEQLQKQKQRVEEQVHELIEERNNIANNNEISGLVEAISEIKNKIFELRTLQFDVEKVEKIESKYVNAMNKRNKALEKYQSFTAERTSIPEILKVKSNLRKSFLNWLDILNTNNINRDVVYRDEFMPVLGRENISQLKGSTRTRVVLAYHAALIELLSVREVGFKFLILDTPKQHEVHNDDLDKYIKQLKSIAESKNIQIIFSTTEYHYQGDDKDIEWNPKYPGEKHNMFLSGNIILN